MDPIEFTALIVSIGAVIISVITLYLTYLRSGKLRFLPPGFVGETTYGGNEMLLLPISAENTGTGAKTARVVVVLNGKKTCFHTLNLERIVPPDVQGKREPGSLLVEPKSTALLIAGFSVVPSEQSPSRLPRNTAPELHLWFNENVEWKFAYRVRWRAAVGSAPLPESSVRISVEQFDVEWVRPDYSLPKSLA